MRAQVAPSGEYLRGYGRVAVMWALSAVCVMCWQLMPVLNLRCCCTWPPCRY